MTTLTHHPVRLLVSLAVALSFVTAALLFLDGTSGKADASCAAPKVFLKKGAVLRPGASVTVKGKWFFADCYDTGQEGTAPPMRHVVLRLKQGGHTWRLGTANADKQGRIHWRVSIPRATHKGGARLVARGNPSGTSVRIHKRHPVRPPHADPVALPATGR